MSDSPFNAALDYCTGFFDGLHFGSIQVDWKVCCYQHDLDYSHLVNKLIADWSLGTCVANHATGWIGGFIGTIMWVGVTTFGGLFYLRAWMRRRKGG